MLLYGLLLLAGLALAGEKAQDYHDGHHDGCGVKGVGPGYEKSYLDYAGQFKGGARKFLPIYQKVHSQQQEQMIRGGCGAHDHECHERGKRGTDGGHHDGCGVKGVGPGYEKSYLDYAGQFKGGARKFLPIYQKVHSQQQEQMIRGGCGAHDHECHERGKRGTDGGHHDGCGVKGVGPGYEKSYLDYAGQFKGGARKFLPIYQKVHSQQQEQMIRGGCGAHDHECHERGKRGTDGGHHDGCGVKGVGPGYEKSYLDYAGQFKGGARKFLPIYQKVHSQQQEQMIRGGCGAHDHECHERGKRGTDGGHHDGCGVKGVGPGYEKSYLDYAGQFKGGARKFLPIYQKVHSQQQEQMIRGGCGAQDHECHEREKRGTDGGHHDGCGVKGVGPGYEKSYLDYAGQFKGGARKFLPIYQKVHSQQQEQMIRGGCGAHDHECHEREKRGTDGGHHDGCGVKGVGPGYEKSYLDYAGQFKGGARKFLPIYQKVHSQQQEQMIRGGCGAQDHECHEREKRGTDGGHHDGCGVKGVGPGYEKSYLDYAGQFKGGARKFLPIYQKVHSQQQEQMIRGGCGAHDHECHEREKRGTDGGHHDGCGVKGVGPGYEKSYLDYAGQFKGGARKFLPIYQKVHSQQQEQMIRGGCGAHDHECHEREKRGTDGGHHDGCGVKGVGPGYEKSYLDYAGQFKGGARKFLPIYAKVHGKEQEVLVRGGAWQHKPHVHRVHQEQHKGAEEKHEERH